MLVLTRMQRSKDGVDGTIEKCKDHLRIKMKLSLYDCLFAKTQPTSEISANWKNFESVKLKIWGFFLCHSMPISDCEYIKNTVCNYFNIYIQFKITCVVFLTLNNFLCTKGINIKDYFQPHGTTYEDKQIIIKNQNKILVFVYAL